MTCVRSRMLVFPVFELLLFLGTTGLSHALRVHDENESPVARHPRDNQLELFSATTIPNHLPEEAGDPRLLFTPAPFITTAGSRTTSKTNQLLSSLMTTTVAPLPKTMDPTVKIRDAGVSTTLATGIQNLTDPTLTSSPSYSENSTKGATTDSMNNSWTAVSSPSPPLTTEKAPRCNCSAEGTVDPDSCDSLTGHCICLPGYSGSQCQECEDGYFTNGTSGCLPCACDSYGSTVQACDGSGVCVCKEGVYGDKCDDCRPGYFHFSSTGCQPCQCNNHTNYCDTQSGICLNCQGNTRGPSCEQCKYNFYRDPGSGPTDACLPCPCSTVTSSGSCTLDSSGRPVCDQCQPEYQGPHCSQCRDGFYNADSICAPCDCSGNASPDSAPRTCHPDTGICLSCTANTTGQRCERCAPGFHGDALAHNCTPTVLPTPEQSSTMTPIPNVTGHLPTSPATLLSTLTTANGSSGPGEDSANVSWGQFNVIVLAVIIVTLVALMGAAAGTYAYREYQNRKLNAPFWTIELKEDNISFSSYHDSLPNADASGLLEDEANDVAPNGQLTLSGSGNLYKA